MGNAHKILHGSYQQHTVSLPNELLAGRLRDPSFHLATSIDNIGGHGPCGAETAYVGS